MNGNTYRVDQGIGWRRRSVTWACLVGVMTTGLLMAASPEEVDFVAASSKFRDKDYATAERWFADFVRLYPRSPRRFEAILGLAEARYFLKTNPADSIQMLSTNVARAGQLGSDYLFWIGEIHFQNSNYLAAATNYARVRQDFAASTNVLAAAYSEAFAYSLLGQSANVIQLLEPPSGPFQMTARTNAGNPFVARGALLLAGTLLDQKKYQEGEAALAGLMSQSFGTELNWKRQELFCRLLMEEGKLRDALAGTTKLMELAGAAGRPELLAQSYILKAGIHEQLNELDLAERAYTNNFATGVPPQFRRGALLKVIELDRRRDRAMDSIGNLEAFAGLYPQDPILDVIQFTLGEVRLKEFHWGLSQASDPATNASPVQATNLLVQAITNFSRVIDGFQQSPLVGKSLLDRGWCWSGLTNLAKAEVDFGAAARTLPAGGDQDLARFKQAESEVQLNDFTNAVQNFRRLIVQHAPTPGSITNSLLEQALTEMLNAAISIGDPAAAQEAFTRLNQWFPESSSIPWATLSYGGSLIKGRPGVAREEVFKNLLEKFPDFAMTPEVRWAVARTYKREEKWSEAIQELDRWVVDYTNHAARPQIEFERAMLYAQSGDATNALRLFTNFVATFPAHTNAPAAQFWVGNQFYNESRFDLAEASFETLYQNTNWPASDLKFLARLSAGQAALARQNFKAARDYLSALIEPAECPPLIRGDALFELGNVSIRGLGTDPIFKDGYGDAINWFEEMTKKYPTHPKAAMAECLIGHCHFQKASEEQQSDQVKKRLDNAAQAFRKAMEWPAAGITTRSFAEFGLALVLERQNEPDNAGTHLSAVFYGKNRLEGEHSDAYFVKEAGLELARLYEEQQRGDLAIPVLETLGKTIPPLRESMKLRIERIQKKSAENKPL